MRTTSFLHGLAPTFNKGRRWSSNHGTVITLLRGGSAAIGAMLYQVQQELCHFAAPNRRRLDSLDIVVCILSVQHLIQGYRNYNRYTTRYLNTRHCVLKRFANEALQSMWMRIVPERPERWTSPRTWFYHFVGIVNATHENLGRLCFCCQCLNVLLNARPKQVAKIAKTGWTRACARA